MTDNWLPAGVGVFAFLPIVNQANTGGAGNERRRVSSNGAVVYSDTDVPNSEVPYSAWRSTTYWTEFNQVQETYYEYFAGSGLSAYDPMFGRLNRIYAANGVNLLYWYSPTATGNQILRKITGLGGNLVPYFAYKDETFGPYPFQSAQITSIYLVNVADATQNRSMYFEYVNYNAGFPFLSKIVMPSGCVRQYAPVFPPDGFSTYKIALEVDPEGNTTYFNYSSALLSSAVEPGGRLIYFEYTPLQTVRTDQDRPQGVFKYQTTSGGNNALVTSYTDGLGNTTYFTNDASVGKMSIQVEANGNATAFGWMGGALGGSTNRQALVSTTSLYNGAQTYYQYSPNTFLVKGETGPRHVPGSYPVVAYYVYDADHNTTDAIDPFGNVSKYAYLSGMRIRELDARGYASYFDYDDLGQLISSIDPLGAAAKYLWNVYGDKLQAVSPRWTEFGGLAAFTTYFAYDQAGQPQRTLDPLGGVTYHEWTGQGYPLAIVDARGTDLAYTRDRMGNETGVSVTDASGTLLSRTLYALDKYTNRITEQDFLGNVTYFVYDVNDRMTSALDALGNRTYFSYDTVRNLTRRVDTLQNATSFFYDPLSRLTAQTDALGNAAYFFYDLADNRTSALDERSFATYYFYDALNRVQATRDALGNPTYFYFDAVGNTSAVRDARFNATYFFYDPVNRRAVTRDPRGIATYFGYDAMGNLVRSLDARLSATYFAYDALDRLKSRTDALGQTTYFYMDAIGNTTALRDPRGNAAYYFYDGLSRRTARWDALGNPAYFFYDGVGNSTAQRDALGNAAYFFYDALSRPTAARDPLANASYFFYDAVGNRTRARDARGNATYYFYDALYRLSTRRDSLGNAAYFFYDAAGNTTKALDARGNTGYFTYDALGRVSELRKPAGSLLRNVFDAVGNLLQSSQTDDVLWDGYGVQSYGTTSFGGRLAVTYFFYDELSRLTARRDPQSNFAYFTYDLVGNRLTVRNALLHVTYFGYDAINRLTRIQDPLAATTYFEFDAAGNMTKVLDPDQHALMTRYDTVDRPDAIRMADAGSTYFFYDAVSNRSKEINPRGNATYYGYDGLRRATRIQDAVGQTLYFEYDPVGSLSKTMDSEGSTSVYTFDALNRRTNCAYTAAGSEVAASLRSDPYYVYDETGNLTQMGDQWGLHRMGYDSENRLTRHLYPKGQVVYYEYTFRSQRKLLVYPGSAGRLRSADDLLQRQVWVQAPSGATAYFAYDAASNLTQRVLGNSAKQDATYDAAERLQQWRNTNKNGASLTYFDYTRDSKGLITKAVREATHTVYYQYDANDRLLTEIWAKTGASPSEVYGYRYAYDLTGNRTKGRANGSDTYYLYDQANRLTAKGTNAAYATPTYYVYDKNGSLTDFIEPSGTTKYAYNAAGLVARLRWRDASATYFFYDGNLQRYALVAAGATVATYFLWDGPNLLQELNADGTVKEEHTNALSPIGGIGQLVETNRPGQTPQKVYPIMDPRGSITKQLQSDGTTVQAAREYDAFGTIIPNSATGTWLTRFGYQGQAWLELLSADGQQRRLLSPTRIYDPGDGRFLQQDPIVRNRPTHHYLYCNNNPIVKVDPKGDRSYVIINRETKTIQVVTRILVTSDSNTLGLALDVDQVRDAEVLAGDIARTINRNWNNDGFGWNVALDDGTYKLYVTPEIYAVSQKVLDEDKAYYSDFDIMRYGDFGQTDTDVRGLYSEFPYPEDFSITVNDPKRTIPRCYKKKHTTSITPSGREKPWNIAHEYGHVLGLIDRYTVPFMGVGRGRPDQDWENRIMGGGIGESASSAEMMEFMKGLAGLPVKWITSNTKGANFRTLPPGKYSGLTYSDWRMGRGPSWSKLLKPPPGWEEIGNCDYEKTTACDNTPKKAFDNGPSNCNSCLAKE
jgi:RHS repeat-associated protein